MPRILLIALILLSAFSLRAQEPGAPPSTDVPRADPVPILQLSYYTGVEGARRQELIHLDLVDWTPDKDVLITSEWISPPQIFSPGAKPPRRMAARDPFKARWSRVPTRRHWVVEYVDAVTEGESHLFVHGAGLPRLNREIRSADDVFGFAYIPSYGWYETGKAARALRYRSPPINTQNPVDGTRPSPSDTQNPPDTRSR